MKLVHVLHLDRHISWYNLLIDILIPTFVYFGKIACKLVLNESNGYEMKN